MLNINSGKSLRWAIFLLVTFVFSSEYTPVLGSEFFQNAVKIETSCESVYASEEIKLRIIIEVFEDLANVEIELRPLHHWFLIVRNKEELGNIRKGETRILIFHIETSKYTPPGTYLFNYTVRFLGTNLSGSVSNYVYVIVKERTPLSFWQEWYTALAADVRLYISLIIGGLIGFLFNRIANFLDENNKRKRLRAKYINKSSIFLETLKGFKDNTTKREEVIEKSDELVSVLKQIEESSLSDRIRDKAITLLYRGNFSSFNDFFLLRGNFSSFNSETLRVLLRDYEEKWKGGQKEILHADIYKMFDEVLTEIEELRRLMQRRIIFLLRS